MKSERTANKKIHCRALCCPFYHNYADDFVTYESICCAMRDERKHFCSRATKVLVKRFKYYPQHKDVFSKRSFFSPPTNVQYSEEWVSRSHHLPVGVCGAARILIR